MRTTLLLAASLAAIPAPAIRAAEPPAQTPFSWQRDTGSLALLGGARIVWRFNYGPGQTKPCFHPLALPGGPELTWDRPPDHVWHRALWFSWKFLDGVNYWEEDPATGKAAGRTEWEVVSLEARPDFSARLVLNLDYRPAGGARVLKERRLIDVSAPGREGQYALDWDLTFTAAGADVLLDRTPLPDEKDGKPYGGYAGLSIRLAKDLREPQAVTLDGPVTFASGRFRGKSPAMDYSGLFGGVEAGVAIFDHPQNLNAPSPWYAIDDGPLRYFSPAVICYQPHTLKATQDLRLRYRVVVHPGRWDAARLRAASLR